MGEPSITPDSQLPKRYDGIKLLTNFGRAPKDRLDLKQYKSALTQLPRAEAVRLTRESQQTQSISRTTRAAGIKVSGFYYTQGEAGINGAAGAMQQMWKDT